mmetsp:Transcript_15997/g.27090  ORF Transcript_15997/g.27090 Transcript_15997/m.27090 type:complete len:215 (-) Transcript_15997:256-900(-)
MCKKMRKKLHRPIPVLEQRLERVKRQLVESQFELDVDRQDVEELEAENKYLQKKIRKGSGEQALQDTLEELTYKKKKYEKKIRALSKAKDGNEQQCYDIVRHMLQESVLRDQLNESQILLLEHIDAANQRLSKEKQKQKRQRSMGTRRKKRTKSNSNGNGNGNVTNREGERWCGCWTSRKRSERNEINRKPHHQEGGGGGGATTSQTLLYGTPP